VACATGALYTGFNDKLSHYTPTASTLSLVFVGMLGVWATAFVIDAVYVWVTMRRRYGGMDVQTLQQSNFDLKI
jgi:1,4-dihydroxy-2-naphthoate octaprenyltransferase